MVLGINISNLRKICTQEELYLRIVQFTGNFLQNRGEIKTNLNHNI